MRNSLPGRGLELLKFKKICSEYTGGCDWAKAKQALSRIEPKRARRLSALGCQRQTQCMPNPTRRRRLWCFWRQACDAPTEMSDIAHDSRRALTMYAWKVTIAENRGGLCPDPRGCAPGFTCMPRGLQLCVGYLWRTARLERPRRYGAGSWAYGGGKLRASSPAAHSGGHSRAYLVKRVQTADTTTVWPVA